jgi:hypothetical protein
MATSLPATQGVVERLQDQATAAALHRLLDHLDVLTRALELLAPLVAQAKELPGLVAMTMDSADELARQAHDSGIDIAAGVSRGASAALRFGAVMDAEKVRSLEALLRSGVLDPHALAAVGALARALQATAASQPSPVGPLGLLRAASDPDVQRALGFLVEFGRRFGKGLAQATPGA